MTFAIIAICGEVKGSDGGDFIHAGSKVVVINDTEGWVSHTTRSLWAGETLPKDTMTFPTKEKAEAFAQSLQAKTGSGQWKTWHPWYVQPTSWEIVELKPVTHTKTIGFKVSSEKPHSRSKGNLTVKPSTDDPDWRDKKQFYRSEAPCCICGRRFRIGIEPRFLYDICEEHSTLSLVQVGKHRKDMK